MPYSLFFYCVTRYGLGLRAFVLWAHNLVLKGGLLSWRDTSLDLCINKQLTLSFVSSHLVIFLIWNMKCYNPKGTCVFLFFSTCACVLHFLTSALDLSFSSALVRRLFQDLGEIWFHWFFCWPYKPQHCIIVGVELTLLILFVDSKTIG